MITVTRTLLVHSSQTKFYQIYELTSEQGNATTLLHWGKIKGTNYDNSTRPVLGGQTKIELGLTGSKILASKKKRDYIHYSNWAKTFVPDTSGWIGVFGASLGDQLKVAMFPRGLSPVATGPTDDLDNSFIPESLVSVKPRPANWGSW